jgi:hypothetical protein
METRTVYFDTPGPHNTAEVLQLAHSRAEALGVRSIVVASYTGATGAQAAQLFGSRNLIVVGGVYGFKEPNQVRMQEQQRALIESEGGKLLFTGHAFGMLGRAVNRRFGAIQVDEIIANVLRLLSQGFKVACEVTCMAADAGLIQVGEEVIAIGGSSTGADSAIVVRASNTHTFFDTRILEIICKPRG